MLTKLLLYDLKDMLFFSPMCYRCIWADYFSEEDIQVAFWSAVIETEKQDAKDHVGLKTDEQNDVNDSDSDSDSDQFDSADRSDSEQTSDKEAVHELYVYKQKESIHVLSYRGYNYFFMHLL